MCLSSTSVSASKYKYRRIRTYTRMCMHAHMHMHAAQSAHADWLGADCRTPRKLEWLDVDLLTAAVRGLSWVGTNKPRTVRTWTAARAACLCLRLQLVCLTCEPRAATEPGPRRRAQHVYMRSRTPSRRVRHTTYLMAAGDVKAYVLGGSAPAGALPFEELAVQTRRRWEAVVFHLSLCSTAT